MLYRSLSIKRRPGQWSPPRSSRSFKPSVSILADLKGLSSPGRLQDSDLTMIDKIPADEVGKLVKLQMLVCAADADFTGVDIFGL